MSDQNQPSGMQTFGAAAFIAFIALGIYGFFAASGGAIVLAVAALGASIGAFVSHNTNERRAQLDQIARNTANNEGD